MIKVEKIIQKNAVESASQTNDNEKLLQTGSVKEVKKSYLPWILLALAAIGFGWYFLRAKKGSGTNEGVHS